MLKWLINPIYSETYSALVLHKVAYTSYEVPLFVGCMYFTRILCHACSMMRHDKGKTYGGSLRENKEYMMLAVFVLTAQDRIPHSAIMHLCKDDAYCNDLLRLFLTRERGVTIQT